MAWRTCVTIVLLVGSVGAGCYKPSIQDGGLRCAAADGGAKACPEGFHCGRDGTCREGPAMACLSTSPHVEPLCDAVPGTVCDPICQNGCECGQCNLVGTALMCTRRGTKMRGELCNAAADDCAPGNVCFNYCGGDRGARCYRYCGKGAAGDHTLCGGNLCGIALNPGGQPEWLLCEPPLEACNPVGDNNDCAEPATFGCYIGPTGSPVCDCRGTVSEGGVCGPYNSCVPGFSCVQVQATDPALCFKTCRLGGSDCPTSATCTPLPGNDTFGFCRA